MMWLAQTQPRKASNSAGKRRNVLKIPETAGFCFLSKHHPRVLPDFSLRVIKMRFNLHHLFLELVLMDQRDHFSPLDQAGRRCWSSSSPSCPRAPWGWRAENIPLLRHLLAACLAEDLLPDLIMKTNRKKGREHYFVGGQNEWGHSWSKQCVTLGTRQIV